MFLTAAISVLLSAWSLVEGPQVAENEYHARLHFEWDKSRWEQTYFDNAEAADALADLLWRLGTERIESVTVVAYSSPEGVYEHNLKLSRERAANFLPALKSRLPDLGGRFFVRAGGEAWALLRERVAADPKIRRDAKARELRILDDKTISDDTRKWRLAHWLEESDYRYLLYAHYRFLRCFDITVVFKDDAAVAGDAGQKAAAAQESAATVENVRPEAAAPVGGKALPEGAIGEDQKPASATEDRVAGQTEIERKQSGHETEEAVAGKVAKGGSGASARARERRAVFALSTNLPYDITYVPHYGLTSIPSFSAEYYPANYGRFSFGADFECPFWAHPEDHRYLQANYLTVNGRYYFGHDYKSDYRGPYLIVGLGGVRFGIGYDEKGWQGEGVSLSAGLGYKRSIGRSRFFWEAGLSVGWLHALYDPYVWGDDTTLRYYFDYAGLPENFSKRNHALDWLGPTRAWLAIGIDLFSRKVR